MLVNTPEYWDERMAVGGTWEQKGGREQTRAFARDFCVRTMLAPRHPFLLLDAACGLGDAIPILRTRFPSACLDGLDCSKVAVDRAVEEYQEFAIFYQSHLAGLWPPYDVVYCSNCLEHFPNWKEVARVMLERCDHLCLLSPLEEHRNGKPLDPSPDREHQVSFTPPSFDFLLGVGMAGAIQFIPFESEGWRWGQQGLWEICRKGGRCERLHP